MNDPGSELKGRRLLPGNRTPLQRLGFAVGATVCALLLRMVIEPIVHDKLPFASFIIATVAVAWYGGFWPSLVPFVLGFFLANWFFIGPYHTIYLKDEAHITNDLSYIIVGSSIILFGRAMHLARHRADANAREAVGHQRQLEQEVTERKRAEEEVRTLNADLEKRVEMRTAELMAINQELESFTYSVSHDLRAPLRHVDGYAQILDEEFGKMLPEEARRFTKKIRQGSQNMGRLVDDLLNLSRVGKKELTRQEIPLNAMVEALVEEMKADLTERNIEWQVGELPVCECDAGLMRQVFTNLLSNAVKYTRPRTPAKIEVGQLRNNGETAVFVRDNGVGFNMKHADKLFGVFQRLHRSEEFEGTGVGLATVARIVRKHGGRVWVEAEVNKGATFFFTLDNGEVHAVKPANGEAV